MRFLFLICFLFVGLFAKAQFPITQNQGSPTTLIKSRGGQQIDSGLVIGIFADTTAANAGFIDAIPGIMIRTTSPLNTLWYRNSVATRWLSIGTADSITGKLNISDTAAMLAIYLRQAYRIAGQDSIRFIRGDGTDFAVLDSTGGVPDSLITNGIIEIDAPENQLLRYGGDNWRNTYRTDSSLLPKAVTDSLYLTNIYYVMGSGVDTLKQEKDGVLTVVGLLSQNNQGGSSGTYIVNGCAVVWTGTGLTFYITGCACYINGTLYTAPDTTVTLDAADATYNRIDAFVMDTSSASYNVTGTAEENPITPQADPTYQILLTSVLVNANDTAFAAPREVIYNNNSVGEWTNSSPIAYPIDFFSTAETFIPPYAADWLSGGPQRLAYFTLGADSINVSGYQSISAFVKLKAALASANSSVAVQFYNNGQAVSTVTRFPLVRTNTDWQVIQLPLSSFAYLTPNRWVDSLVVSYRNFNGAAAITGMYFDYFSFNSGINPPNPNGNNVDSFYYSSEVLNDSMFVMKRSDGRRDTLTIVGNGLNFANADLTATGDRVHDFSGRSLSILEATSFLVYNNMTHGGIGVLSLNENKVQLAHGNGLSSVNSSYVTLDSNELSFEWINKDLSRHSRLLLDSNLQLFPFDSIRIISPSFIDTPRQAYTPTTSSTAKYKAVLMDSTTGALVTTSPSNIGGGNYVDSVYRVAGVDSINIRNSAGYTYKVKDSTGIGGTLNDSRLVFSANGQVKDTSILSYDRANVRVGIGTAAPTHSLTFPSTSTGIALYNTADQTTNYERILARWVSNEYRISFDKGGTGSVRPIFIGNPGGDEGFRVTPNNAITGRLNVQYFNVGIGSLFGFNGTMTASGAGTTNGIALIHTVNQSYTSGYRGLWISPYLQALGSGTNRLVDVGTNTAASGAGTHTSLFNISNTGQAYFANTVGIGTTSPNASALLDITSTTKGFLTPRLTGTQQNAVSSPATGLLVYNTDSVAHTYYNGSAWRKYAVAGSYVDSVYRVAGVDSIYVRNKLGYTYALKDSIGGGGGTYTAGLGIHADSLASGKIEWADTIYTAKEMYHGGRFTKYFYDEDFPDYQSYTEQDNYELYTEYIGGDSSATFSVNNASINANYISQEYEASMNITGTTYIRNKHIDSSDYYILTLSPSEGVGGIQAPGLLSLGSDFIKIESGRSVDSKYKPFSNSITPAMSLTSIDTTSNILYRIPPAAAKRQTSGTPSGTSDTQGEVGDILFDDNYIYIKTSAGWKRTALSTF